MIFPGGNLCVTTTTGGLGLSVTDPQRPDLGPARPGYVVVSGSSATSPQPPAFLSVTASGGRLQVTVLSEAPVDGYQIGISATSYEAPTVWWSTSSGSIDQEQTGGPWYLWARATYRGACSLWSVYGQVRPEDAEWRLAWADESMAGTVDQAYPYTVTEFGAPAIYYDYIAGVRLYSFPVDYEPSLSTLTASGGAHGTRVDFILRWGGYPSSDLGVVLGFDPAAMTADHTTATYYALTLHDGESAVWTLRLYSGVGTSYALVAESADIASHITAVNMGDHWEYHIALSAMARENAFSVETADGTVLLAATDTTYPWTAERVGVGLWAYTGERYYVSNYVDYLRVYARDHTGEAETVTPGAAPHNDLDGRTATACHPASAVTVTPAGGIAATDVQAALVELDGEKAAAVHTHVEGDVQLSGPDVIVGRATAGAGGAEEIACTAAGRALLDDADAAAQRTTLGIASGTVWTSENDGPGSGLDACSVDGIQGASIAQKIASTATITVGPSGRDFTTIQAALDSLKGKVLAALVAINVDAGDYAPFSYWGQPYGRLIQVVGDTRVAAGAQGIATGSISKDGDNCTITLTAAPPSDYGAGDYITVADCTTAANVGRFPIVSVDTVNFTVTYVNSSGVAEAVKTGTRVIWNANRTITNSGTGLAIGLGSDINAIKGFTLLGLSTSQGIGFSAPILATITHCHAYGILVGFGGYCGGAVTYDYVAAVKCTYGIYHLNGCSIMMYNANAHNCTYGLLITDGSVASNTDSTVTITGNTAGVHTAVSSAISLHTLKVVCDNTTDYSPTPGGTGGNYGSYIKV